MPDAPRHLAHAPRVGPSRDDETASPLFFKSLLHDLGFKLLFDIHLAQAGVLRLQFLHTRHHGYIHAAVLRAPLVEGCRADAQLPAKLRYRQAGLYPLERFHDLTIRKPRPLHLVELLNEKILLLNAPLLRGDYLFWTR